MVMIFGIFLILLSVLGIFLYILWPKDIFAIIAGSSFYAGFFGFIGIEKKTIFIIFGSLFVFFTLLRILFFRKGFSNLRQEKT